MRSPRLVITGSAISTGLPQSLARGFRAIGWQTHIFDDQQIFERKHGWATSSHMYRMVWRPLAKTVQAEFLATIWRLRPDVVLVLKGFYFSDETIAKAKQASPTTAFMHFNPDNSFNRWHFGNSNDWIRKSIPLFNLHLTWGRFLMPLLLEHGAKKVVHLPFACDPDIHRPLVLNADEETRYGGDISFVGSWDEEREWWASQLLDRGLKIWGNAWNRAARSIRNRWQRRALLGDEFSKACGASKINLNIIRKQNIPAHNMRTFEIPACGGFMLSTRTSEQRSIWAEGEEIACFSSPEELREQVDRYLRDDEARKTMAARACARARVEYTYTETARRIEAAYAESHLTPRANNERV